MYIYTLTYVYIINEEQFLLSRNSENNVRDRFKQQIQYSGVRIKLPHH